MKSTSVIRKRGQLTIPESIRKAVNWANPMSAVTISLNKTDEIVIKPHQHQHDWDKIWKGIRKSRATKGDIGAVASIEFLEKDRKSH